MRFLPDFLVTSSILISGCTYIAPTVLHTQQNYDWPAYANDSFSSKYGPLLTSALLFIAVAGVEPQLRVFDKFTGELVHKIILPASPAGTPMTYMADGNRWLTRCPTYYVGSALKITYSQLPDRPDTENL